MERIRKEEVHDWSAICLFSSSPDFYQTFRNCSLSMILLCNLMLRNFFGHTHAIFEDASFEHLGKETMAKQARYVGGIFDQLNFTFHYMFFRFFEVFEVLLFLGESK